MHSFAIASLELAEGVVPAVVAGDDVYDVRIALPGIRRTGDLFAEWDRNLDLLEAHLAAGAMPLGSFDDLTSSGAARVLPPVQPVGPVLAAGANYREHIIQMSVAHGLGSTGASPERLRREAAAEIDERVRTGDPYVWTGIPSAVSGAYDEIRLPDVGTDVDWELELGVVIGRTAHRVSVHEALDYVAGYTIVNDLTARSLVPRDDMAKIGTDWFRAKNQPGFFPTGPMARARAVRARPRGAANAADIERPSHAGCDDRGSRVRCALAPQLRVIGRDPATGRPPHHRLARRQRLALEAVPHRWRRRGVDHRGTGRRSATWSADRAACFRPGRRAGRDVATESVRPSGAPHPGARAGPSRWHRPRGATHHRQPCAARRSARLATSTSRSPPSTTSSRGPMPGPTCRLVAQTEATTPLGVYARPGLSPARRSRGRQIRCGCREQRLLARRPISARGDRESPSTTSRSVA